MIKWLIEKYSNKLQGNPNYIRQKPMGRGSPTWDEWAYLQQFDWYYDEFTLNERFKFKQTDLDSNIQASKPTQFFRKNKHSLKVFNHKNLDAVKRVMEYFYLSHAFSICVLILIILYCPVGLNENLFRAAHHTICYFFLLPFFIFCSISLKIVNQAADVPYAIFDGFQNKMIIRGKKGDEAISYDRISFQLLSISDTALGGAIEMNISYDEHGLPPRQIITDIFETPQQAHSILKTYYTILSGDQTIFEQTLKPHPVTWREFNLPFWQAATAYRASSMRWLMCVFPHYLCFRLIHGHPMAVLREYEMEKEL